MIGNVADLVGRAARRDADHAALLYGSERLSWGELDERVNRAAAALRGLGMGPGERVAVRLANTPNFPISYFGALRAGLVVVPMNTEYTEAEQFFLLADSGATTLITDVDGVDAAVRIRTGLPALRHLVVADAPPSGTEAVGLDELLAVADPEPVEPATDPDTLAVLSYTSGTSGRPKGAMLGHRVLLANLDQCARMTQPPVVAPADVVLLVLPLFHIYGLNAGLGMVAWAGATGLLTPRFDADETLALMARHRVTNVPAQPRMFVAWSRAGRAEVTAGFASVRLALSGAAPLPVDTVAVFAELGVTVHEGYGLTEAAPVMTSTLMSDSRKAGSVGRALPDAEVELRDEFGAPVEDDDPGELVVRGPNLFDGYWPDRRSGPDQDGWFATGDVGYADTDGDLHLIDRRRELVLVSGFNVYPAEVEAALTAHPDVAEAAVIGVPHEVTGEAVLAYLVTRAPISQEQVVAHCERSLARFKCPTEVRFVAALPHSATGKVRKALLREWAATDPAVDTATGDMAGGDSSHDAGGGA